MSAQLDWVLDGVAVQAGDTGRPVLDDVGLTFRAGRIAAVVGPSGAGKTTLLETMAGLCRPNAGSVTLGGLPVWRGGKPRREALLQFGLAMQRSEAQWFAPTVRAELAYAMKPYLVPAQGTAQRASVALAAAGLSDGLLDRVPWTLSGGEQRRLAWACLIAAGAPWLLLDEPTAGLDDDGVRTLRTLLAAHRAAGGGAVIVTHDLDALWPAVDDVVVLAGGRVREAAPAAEWAAYAAGGRSAVPAEALPQPLYTAQVLRAGGLALPAAALAPEELAALLAAQLAPPAPAVRDGSADGGAGTAPPPEAAAAADTPPPAHPWAQRDPRALWAAYLLVASGLLAMDSWADAAVFGAVTAAIALHLNRLLRPYRGLILTYACIIGGMTIVSGLQLHPIGFDAGSAGKTSLMLLRLMMAMIVGMPLLGLISPYRLQQAIERPMRAVGIGRRTVRSVALTVSLLFRFIPLMAKEWGRFARIGASRGKIPVKPGRVPVRQLHTVLIPFMLGMLQTADRLAWSLELRGFGQEGWTEERTYPIRFTRKDAGFVACAALLLGALLAADRFL